MRNLGLPLPLDGGGTGGRDAAAARSALSLGNGMQRRVVADVSQNLASTESCVALTSLTATRTLTLPPASSFPAGQPLYIMDETGACSLSVRIVVAAASGDTIAGQSSFELVSPYQKIVLHSNGSNLWTV